MQIVFPEVVAEHFGFVGNVGSSSARSSDMQQVNDPPDSHSRSGYQPRYPILSKDSSDLTLRAMCGSSLSRAVCACVGPTSPMNRTKQLQQQIDWKVELTGDPRHSARFAPRTGSNSRGMTESAASPTGASHRWSTPAVHFGPRTECASPSIDIVAALIITTRNGLIMQLYNGTDPIFQLDWVLALRWTLSKNMAML